MAVNTQPIIKWSGSKRSQAGAIVARMPKEIDTYYEPFCGGCSVLYRLLQTPSIHVDRYVASDKNKDLIELWKMIRQMPDRLMNGYAYHWREFNSHGEDFNWRKDYFTEVRKCYNIGHNPIDFLFIMRTTINGMPRYNGDGAFNSSCHFSRPGIDPKTLAKVCEDWHRILRTNNVEFVCQEYDAVVPGENDLLYLDPPYGSVNRHQMYFGGIDLDKFFAWLRHQPCKWLMSFDGIRGNNDYTKPLPEDLYACHEYLDSGNSSFSRYLGKGDDERVRESLYSNYPGFQQIVVPSQANLF